MNHWQGWVFGLVAACGMTAPHDGPASDAAQRVALERSISEEDVVLAHRTDEADIVLFPPSDDDYCELGYQLCLDAGLPEPDCADARDRCIEDREREAAEQACVDAFVTCYFSGTDAAVCEADFLACLEAI